MKVCYLHIISRSYSNTLLLIKGSFKRYVTPEGGNECSKLCYEPLRKLRGGEGVSVMPLRTAVKNFYMANFTRILLIRNYSFYLQNPGIPVKIILATD